MAPKYAAVIDAGSTSSRLFIYKWEEVPAPGGNRDAHDRRYGKPIKFESLFGGKEPEEGPGIHSDTIKDTVEHLQTYLTDLLDKGAAKLANENPAVNTAHSVPLYVMATAGVRSGRNDAVQKVIMRLAWDAVHNLRDAEARRRVFADGSDGVEDGDITDAIKDAHSFAVPAVDKMPGVLELGGQSMQIAYTDPTLTGGDITKTVCLFKSRHKLSSRSWEFGAEVSRSKAVENKLVAIDDGQDSETPFIYNPCLPHHQLFFIDDDHPSIGSGDFPKCLAMAQSYLENDAILPVALPALDIEPFTKRFYGVSSFWYTYQFFAQEGFYNEHDAYDPKLFRQAVDQYCKGSWLQPFGWNEGKVRDTGHIHKHCFAAAWMMSLFHSRKGFNLRLSDHETWKGLIRFPSTPDLASRSSWTIGAATMIARNGDPKAFCGEDEDAGQYPPARPAAIAAYNETTILPITSGSPVRQPIVSSSRVLVAPPALNTPPSLEPIHAPGAPAPVAPVRFFHDLPIGTLNQASTFSQGVVCGALLLLLVFIGYRRFAARRAAPASVPDSDEKHAISISAQPIMVRAHRALFDKAKGAIFLAGENASIA